MLNQAHSIKRDSVEKDFLEITKRDVFALVAKFVLTPEE